MKVILSSIVVITSISLAGACYTLPRGRSDKISRGPSKRPILLKEGKKSARDDGQLPSAMSLHQPETHTLPTTTLDTKEKPSLSSLLERLIDSSLQLDDSDIQEAIKSQAVEPGSLAEAVFIAAQLRLLRLQIDQQSGFQSQDLYGGSETAQPQKHRSQHLSLEQTFQSLQIDLPRAFSMNPQLQNKKLYELTTDLLERTENSKDFYEAIHSFLDKQDPSPKKTEMVVQKPISTYPNLAIRQEPEKSESNPNESEHIEKTDNIPDISDLKSTDSLLMAAQKLADKSEFKLAINQIVGIEKFDPFFDQAKEKIKIYSNQAVQDLRKRAAEAFQNSMPLSEAKAKIAYLTQAQNHLEKAIKDFPDADQLERVRENLDIIKRDLVQLEKDLNPGLSKKN